MTEEHAILLRSFNAFRSNAIMALKSNSKGKLDSLQQALSLNGILHLQEDDNTIYCINQATWNELMSTYKSQFHKDPFTSSEKVQIAEMVGEFEDACKDGGDLGDVVEEMSSRRSNNMTPNVRRCLNMMRNLAELLNSSWNPKELTENSLTVNAYDPIASAFLGKIESARYYGNDKELGSSKWRKQQQMASNVAGRKPDRSIDVKATDGTVFNVYEL